MKQDKYPYPPKKKPRHIIFKLQKTEGKEILKEAGGEKTPHLQRNKDKNSSRFFRNHAGGKRVQTRT